MSAKHLSINQRLRKAKAPGLRQQIVAEWLREWHRDVHNIVQQLDTARRRVNWAEVDNAARQLATGTDKRFGALAGVIQTLIDAEATTADSACTPSPTSP